MLFLFFFFKAGLWISIITGYTNVFECLQKILIEGKLEVKGPSQLKNSLLLRCNLFCCWYVFLLISGTWRASELTSIRSERPVYVLLHCAYSYAIAQHSDQLPGQVRSLWGAALAVPALTPLGNTQALRGVRNRVLFLTSLKRRSAAGHTVTTNCRKIVCALSRKEHKHVFITFHI